MIEIFTVCYLIIGVIIGTLSKATINNVKINPFFIKFGMVFMWLPLIVGAYVWSFFDKDVKITKD